MKKLSELDITGNHFSEIPSFFKFLNLSVLKNEWNLYIENIDCPPVDDFAYSVKQYSIDFDKFKEAIEITENDGRSMVGIKDYQKTILGIDQEYSIKTYLNFCIAAVRK